MTYTSQAPIGIIGAGLGGLAAAIYLAAAGKRVIVYEQHTQVGGKMGQYQQDGYTWDTGPSVITLRSVLAELFAVAGRRLEDYLTLLPLDPLTRYFYPDGTVLNASSNWAAWREQIVALEPADVAGYLRHLAQAADLYRVTQPVFIDSSPPTLASFLRVPVRDWGKVDALRTMQAAIESNVRSPHLRQLLGRFATYVGGSPYQAPATLNVIADVELTQGVWYPQGGVYTLAQAYARLARELGVEIVLGLGVRQIQITDNRATGLILADGTLQPTQAVLTNVDVATTYQHLLPDLPVLRGPKARLLRQAPSCSGFILLLGVQGQSETLAHHNIFFSQNYRQEFSDIFQNGQPPTDPTIYVAITSKSTPTAAPPGCENWFVLVNAPALGAYDWQKNAAAYRERVLAQLAVFGHDLRGRIQVERCLTPLDLQAQTGAWRGALYGASANSRWAAFRRPHNRCPQLAGLYFAGGTTHPGGGVPMVTLSGKVAAQMLLADLAGLHTTIG
jgi:phytoene desaturase